MKDRHLNVIAVKFHQCVREWEWPGEGSGERSLLGHRVAVS